MAAAGHDAEPPRVPLGARLPHARAVVTALQAFFGTDKVAFSLDSRVTGHDAPRTATSSDAVDDVDLARMLAGFHFRHSVDVGTLLGRTVARYDIEHAF